MVDSEWQGKLSKIDCRFKYGIIRYDNKAQETRLETLVQKIKSQLVLPLTDRFAAAWTDFLEDSTLYQIDEKAGEFEISILTSFFEIKGKTPNHRFNRPADQANKARLR